ncbi:hypothetical protein F0L68_16730 [Solihabitans fulvus]|uniref:DUF6891 domain-containing protein n=1 Tax=Solihabitans fulvus TaxID=1892852 RepID=A0A5B2XDK5_9PSEU|nr:hypothetical protein [Solihabitans fulvus]KAA2261433.1 hypothetical protein F0L68_16730 [Solihabitans fulvus]
MAEPVNEALLEVEQFARELVHGGFSTREEIAEDVVEHCDPDELSLSAEQAAAMVDRLWQERLAEQAGWPATTEPDRLFEAFEALDANGIVPRADFACCNTCGMAEIGDEAGEGARGFVFFHQQDTASAVAGHGLRLAYGSLPGSPLDTRAVGQEVAAALTAAGLPVEWNGSEDRRICVTPIEWRLRLPQD